VKLSDIDISQTEGGRGDPKRSRDGNRGPVGRSGTSVIFMTRPSDNHLSTSQSAPRIIPSDAPTDDGSLGQPLGDMPEAHDATVEPIGDVPAGADPVGAGGLLPSPTEMIVIGHDAAVEPISEGPAGADPVGLGGLPPTPTETIVTSESTGSSLDVSASIVSASDVNI
jgi:hypothetical protein